MILIPLGGIGDRFKQVGYQHPKALIPIFGKPILYYLLDSIRAKVIVIPYNKEYQNYYFEEKLRKDYPNQQFIFIVLEKNTRGAAESIAIGLEGLHDIDDCPVLCLDGDNFYKDIDIIALWNNQNCVFTFNSVEQDPIFSYVIANEDNTIIKIEEKNKISDNACCGAYGFASWKNTLEYCKKAILGDSQVKGEFYTSGIISDMISHMEMQFKNISIEKKNYTCLGTPIQVQYFYYNYPKVSCDNNALVIKPKRYCFDLDNTLITNPTIPGDYSTVLPIQKNINFLKYLKRFGNVIIIYTARRMKTHNGSIGKVVADIGQLTFETLHKFDIPYDEIYFGKPYADAYIDDLAVNFQTVDMEKYLGWYNTTNNVIAPRSFNVISQATIATITKSSANLSGEIYWYLNIPPELKDIFPLFIDYSLEQGKMYYIMEKIAGVSVSSLYLSELLTEVILKNIMNTIIRIQKVRNAINVNGAPSIYANYTNKLTERYTRYKQYYEEFYGSNNCYQSIKMKLQSYEENNLGKQTCIHGDPVFTNIIINDYGKIKMFDMRGKLGDVETIYGDWLYDWAKIYQSLIGYDSILLEKAQGSDYQRKMIGVFKDYFISLYSPEDFAMLEVITYSLIFSLLPLHKDSDRNNKCAQFYLLIPDIFKECQ